ncbi:uncharacterized protein C8Q71DRAFT_861604 [Rhodofomes roseus]|uniref:Uncharacterized protein n=1 Tax=Rhodofomes roseus TaxID=34475 RepID=A0ABQ8K426_9APHY|nr:uncharacterized protein C8Q71DRAFT_861604 [Rhodofomes roseus]KAH9831585.1 hypothetical protein C8Q71DRAFT_861604 [Rhodofomes roseus]
MSTEVGSARTGGYLHWPTGRSISKVLLRDGTVFFVALFLLYITELLSWCVKNVLFVSDFTLPLMSILVSRFLINLRRAANSSTFTVDTQSPTSICDTLETTTNMSSVDFTPRSADSGADRSPSDVVGEFDGTKGDFRSSIMNAEERDMELGLGGLGDNNLEPDISVVPGQI